MNVVLFGASGRIGQRITNELLDRDHSVTGVSRNNDIQHESSDFDGVSGDATKRDDIVEIIDGHDAVASALGPSEGELEILAVMARALVEGLRETDVDRLVWTGSAGGLIVGSGTKLIDTRDFPDEIEPIAQAHIDALEIIKKADDVDWSYLAPPMVIEPGKRTDEYRTAERRLVTTEDGESYLSMEDFAVAFVDELETGDAVHEQVGVGY